MRRQSSEHAPVFRRVHRTSVADFPVYSGIAETVCVLFFSSALGRWVDGAPSRLRTLILTIVTNRIAVLVSCIIWLLILSLSGPTSKHVFFAIALVLGMVEKLSRGTNILSMERDWVPTLANPVCNNATRTRYDLTHLNTVMRRIDLLCKLVAPLAVSTFISAVGSERIAVAVVASISTSSLGFECWCVQQVWNQNGRLRAPKGPVSDSTENGHDHQVDGRLDGYTKALNVPRRSDHLRQFILDARDTVRVHIEGLQYYFHSPVWIPSVCAAVPHASVLTFSGSMVTYLLNAGFPLNLITVAKATGAAFELGSTILFPWAVSVLAKRGGSVRWHGRREYQHVEMQDRSSRNEDWQDGREQETMEPETKSSDTEQAVIKTVGWWAICGLLLSLVCNPRPSTFSPLKLIPFSKIPALPALFFLESSLSSPPTNPLANPASLIPTILLIASISFSLLFRWTYDLSATQLTQTLIPASHRSSFGGTEMAVVSLISLMHWIAAAVWHAQTEFRWLATGSFVLVGGAVGGYAVWYRKSKSVGEVDTGDDEGG